LLAKLAIVVAAFAVGVGLAELLGATNLGTALGVGQITFVIALLYVLLRRDDSSSGSARQDQTEQ
jgi:hypothetical protein